MKPLVPVVLALAATACAGSSAEVATEKPRALPVRTVPVETRDLAHVLVLTGTLRPRAQVQVVAEVPARLLRLVKDEGSLVGQGEVLAVLDDTDYRLSHERSTAALAVAEANRAHAQAEKERADNLVRTGGITDKDLLQAQVNLQVAEAALAQARAETAIAATQQDRAQIKAPFAGRVARRMADAGAMLTAGMPVFTLVDESTFEFRSSVPSADYGRVKIGDTVDVTVDATSAVTVAGRVARIAPLVDERTRAFEVVVEVPGRRELVGGLFARASVTVGLVKGALVVPPAALVRDGAQPDLAQVFVAAAGKAERRTVSLGVEAPDAIEVTKGLAAGEAVVLDPPAALTPGAPIEAKARNGK